MVLALPRLKIVSLVKKQFNSLYSIIQ